jgi:LPXTG-motif cell wall-anchored protein
LAILLATMLAASLFVALPTKAFAAGVGPDDSSACKVWVGGSEQPGTYSFNDALGMMNAGAGNEIMLLKDIVLNKNFDIKGKAFEFDLNNQELDFNMYYLLVANGSDVTFYNCGGIKNCAFFAATASTVVFNGDLNLSGGCFSATVNASVVLNGNLTCPYGNGLCASDGATVTVTGSVYASGTGAGASTDGTINVYGDIVSTGLGVSATGAGAVVNVGSSSSPVTIRSGDDAINADQGGIVNVWGDLGTAANPISGCGARIGDLGGPGTVTVTGDIYSREYGIWAKGFKGSFAEVVGNINARQYGVVASESNTFVSVTGTIDAGEDGVYVFSSATVLVIGDIQAANNGVYASYGTVYISGTVSTSSTDTSSCAAIQSTDTSKVTVGGNVSASATNGVWALNASEVTIDGVLSAGGSYILYTEFFTNVSLAPEDFIEPTTKPGYLTYTFKEFNLEKWNFVWIKVPGNSGPETGTGPDNGPAGAPGVGPGAAPGSDPGSLSNPPLNTADTDPAIPQTGDTPILWALALMAALLGAATLVLWARRGRRGQPNYRRVLLS